jgi:hypothetical protein
VILLIVALGAIASSVCWLIANCTGTLTAGRLGRQALRECPADQRADILRAVAELADKARPAHTCEGLLPTGLSRRGHHRYRQGHGRDV